VRHVLHLGAEFVRLDTHLLDMSAILVVLLAYALDVLSSSDLYPGHLLLQQDVLRRVGETPLWVFHSASKADGGGSSPHHRG